MKKDSGIGNRMNDFDPVILTPCHTCQHQISGFTCVAFPEGIPFVIRSGEHKHQSPFKGDQGVQWEERK